MRRGVILTGFIGAWLGGNLAVAQEREIPEAFAPFEHMIGSWKGMGIPTANRLKGWPEKHMWAWKFAKGNPVGMALELEGDKSLTRAQLSHDAATKQYRLEGTDAAGKPVAYVGGFDRTGKSLVLDREGDAAAGKERVVLRPNSNLIRYTMEFDVKEPGAPQYKHVVEVGLTKEGESFAAGGSAANLPRCIITGGTATMSVSYKGQSFPICCSGCKDEFDDNPEKYVKKAVLAAEKGARTPVKAATSGVGKDDGSFEGLVSDAPQAKAMTRPARPAVAAPEAPATAATEEAAAKDAARAASQLRIGQTLEKGGKTTAALGYYRKIVKDYPDTPSARTAAARIKALGGE